MRPSAFISSPFETSVVHTSLQYYSKYDYCVLLPEKRYLVESYLLSYLANYMLAFNICYTFQYIGS
jgi:hypothetical protein